MVQKVHFRTKPRPSCPFPRNVVQKLALTLCIPRTRSLSGEATVETTKSTCGTAIGSVQKS